jgi:hypothetical protein
MAGTHSAIRAGKHHPQAKLQVSGLAPDHLRSDRRCESSGETGSAHYADRARSCLQESCGLPGGFLRQRDLCPEQCDRFQHPVAFHQHELALTLQHDHLFSNGGGGKGDIGLSYEASSGNPQNRSSTNTSLLPSMPRRKFNAINGNGLPGRDNAINAHPTYTEIGRGREAPLLCTPPQKQNLVVYTKV